MFYEHYYYRSLVNYEVKRNSSHKTTLRLKNSLEGLTELTESGYTHGYGLLRGKDIDKNQPEEELHRTESGKSTM